MEGTMEAILACLGVPETTPYTDYAFSGQYTKMDSNRIANPTDDHDQTQQPMEDMEVEVSSYQDTYNGTKFPVSETVTIGSGMQVEAENNTIDLDSAIKLEEVTVDTKAHIDSLIFNNEKFVCSPKGPYPQEDQEDYDNDLKEIQEAVRSDVDKIPVKRMRRLVPKMRMAVYMSQDEIRSKRKHKHLWDERPADWEESVPFKDPNNKTGKEGKKPGKEILTLMFILLKKKFVAMCSAPKSDEPKVEKMDSLQVQQPSEETHSIPAPTQEQEPIIIGGTTGVQPEQPVEYSQQNLNAEVNDPVSGLYRRIEQKIRQVEVLVAEYEGCREALHQVFQDIIKSLYIQSKAVTMCGFFLDAGHDLENLLDKGLAFGKLLDASVIKQGCLMICTKYAATQRKFGANLQNIETPIYHVKEEVSEAASATRAQALRQNSIPARMSQTVSDGCAPVYIKQEPMSPGLPFSPATDLVNQMGNVNLQDMDLKVFGISAKRGNQELSSLIDIRTPENAINDLLDLVKDTNKYSKSGFDGKSEVDKLFENLFKDMPDSSNTETMTPTPQMTPQFNGPDQNMINQTIRMTKELNGAPQQIINDVNLNSTCEMTEDALFETVLSLQQDFKWQPGNANSVEASQVSSAAVTNPVYNTPINTFPSQPVGQVQPTIQFNSPSNFANTLPNHMPQGVPQMNQSPAQSVPGIASAGQMPGAPCVPTTVMDIMNSEGEDADKRNGGGKVTNQRHRSGRQGKVTKKGKGKDKYFHV